MVNVPQLQNLDVGGLEAAADAWSGIATKLNSAKESFGGAIIDPLKNGKWVGKDAEAATKVCENIRWDIDAVAIECMAVRKFLDEMTSGSGEGFGNLRTHQRNLADLQREAIGKGFRINDDGSVRWEAMRAPGPVTPEQQKQINDRNAQAAAIEKKVKEVLKDVTDVDDSLARGLKVIFGDEQTFRTEHRGRDTNDADIDDDIGELQLRGVQAYLSQKGWNDGAGLLDHYLDGSGNPVEIDANRLLKEVPQFQTDVNSALGDVRKLPDGSFQTAWKGSSSPHTQNLNWYYGLNNFEYRLVGEKHGNQIKYRVEMQKEYDWGTPSEHRRDLSKGPLHFEQSEIARLNMVGKAKDFRVHGSTGQMTSP
jgi:hypothetical protein